VDVGKVTRLFVELGPGEDPDDTEVRHRMVKERLRSDYPDLDDGSPASEFVALTYQMLSDQIADEDPPEVLQTASRLLFGARSSSDLPGAASELFRQGRPLLALKNARRDRPFMLPLGHWLGEGHRRDVRFGAWTRTTPSVVEFGLYGLGSAPPGRPNS
jgi:hypothetical protein